MIKKILLILVCVWSLLGAVGCEALYMIIPEFYLMQLVQEWAEADVPRHGLSSATGRTGQSDVDAVLGTGDLVSKVEASDKLVEEGMATGDPAKIDQAIANRPTDWSYRVSRASLAIEQNDVTTFTAQLQEAKTQQVKNGDSEISFAKRTARELRAAIPKIEKDGWDSRGQCEALYGGLATQFGFLYQQTKDQRYANDYGTAQRQQTDCIDLPE